MHKDVEKIDIRPKHNDLSLKQIGVLLDKSMTGVLSTVGKDKMPYALPMHFLYFEDKIFIQCSATGRKIQNINANDKVCFTIYAKTHTEADCRPPETSLAIGYQSVVIEGTVSIIDDIDLKDAVLRLLFVKQSPQYVSAPMPEVMLKNICLMQIQIEDICGKYFV